jgi:prolyl-tRNA editing enzyme YbaK/EbsC (Cys-tRNA(Pro) deacylase)
MKEKVIEAARDLGLEVEVRSFPEPTRTTAQAAEAVGCQEAQIAKSLVFVADGEPVVVVTSGGHRVDVEKLCEAADCAEARQASPEEVRSATGYAIGGVPPLGHELPVYFDESLLEHEKIWAAGGDGNTVFEVEPRALADRIGATVIPVSED